MKKKPVLILCSVLLAAAAVSAALVKVRDCNQKEYATAMNSAAKSAYAHTAQTPGLVLPQEDAEAPLLTDGIYSAEYSPSDKKLIYRTADGRDVTESAADFSDRKLYFMVEIKDGAVRQVSACRSKDVLTEENLLTRQTHDPFFAMSLSEYWLNRFIGYAPVSLS